MKKFKKLLAMAALTLTLSSCAATPTPPGSSVQESDIHLTPELTEVVKDITSNSKNVTFYEQPFYEDIGAEDAVQFSTNNFVIKIYQFPSQEAYEKACEQIPDFDKKPIHKLMVIETNDKNAIKSFNKHFGADEEEGLEESSK